VTEDPSFVKTLEKPGSDVIFKDSAGVNRFMESESKNFTELFKQLKGEAKN